MKKENCGTKFSIIGVILLSLFTSQGFSIFVPENVTGDSPVWLSMYENDVAPTEGVPADWKTNFNAALGEGRVVFWLGGSWKINNVNTLIESSWQPADWVDHDCDGLPSSIDPYPQDASNGSSGELRWWSAAGGPWVVDGVVIFFRGRWYHSSSWSDADNDLIPDEIDRHPGDATNNSFYLQTPKALRRVNSLTYGGSSYLLQHTFRSGWYAGNPNDINKDGIPDTFNVWLDDQLEPELSRNWLGGAFLLGGQMNTYAAKTLQALSLIDQDYDGIPDEVDAIISDGSNDYFFEWNGGEFRISGNLTTFGRGIYRGQWRDTDSDLMPDSADPFPTDKNNRTAWWQGGAFEFGGKMRSVPGRWISVDDLQKESDGDGIPDVIDPRPNDVENNNVPQPDEGAFFSWVGGTFIIDGQQRTFSSGEYRGVWSDTDGDNIPDTEDKYPSSLSNNSAFWAGGTFSINGNQQYFPPQWHAANASDSDQDLIPDDIDVYLNDATNHNTFTWSGTGLYRVNGELIAINPTTPLNGTWLDTDSDTIPDQADPYPASAANNSYLWPGLNNVLVNNVAINLPPSWMVQDPPDQDNDGLPDEVDDDYPEDSNNNNTAHWPPVDTTLSIANTDVTFQSRLYTRASLVLDSDSDDIPDVADPYPDDGTNANDTDGDGIPDILELSMPSVLDRENPNDASQLRADGITYLQALNYSKHPAATPAAKSRLLSEQIPGTLDEDRDSMSDLYEIKNGLNPFDPRDAYKCLVSETGQVVDFVFNFEKAASNLVATDSIPEAEYLNYTGVSRSFVVSNHNVLKSAAENDWDGDQVSNVDEVTLFKTNPRVGASVPSLPDIYSAIISSQASMTTLVNFHHLIEHELRGNDDLNLDSDGDGIPDVVEFNLTTFVTDSDTDDDGVTDLVDIDPKDITKNAAIGIVILFPEQGETIK